MTKQHLYFTLGCALFLNCLPLLGQISPTEIKERNTRRDSLFIAEVEDRKEPDKVLHAEPLFIDLIRDLGARKGEAEWNVGLGLTDQLDVDRYNLLVEYEFAPIDRLGLELEIPMTIYTSRQAFVDRPSNRIESIKAAIQWSFYVSEENQTSMALGYINELEFSDLDRITSGPIFKGNLFNPFYVLARRWGNNFHTLWYAGLRVEYPFFKPASLKMGYELHSNIHYMISGTRNFIGVEINKEFLNDRLNIVLRPQMRLQISEETLIGISVGIPVNRESERLGMFMRLIYEPPH